MQVDGRRDALAALAARAAGPTRRRRASDAADTVERRRHHPRRGHAGILADETFYRAGGLACVSPIRIRGLLTTVRPITATTERERRDGYVSRGSRTSASTPATSW